MLKLNTGRKNKFAETKDSKSFWKTVNEATGKSKSKRIGLLRDANNNEVSNDSEKADLINYFINIGKELAVRFPETDEKTQFVYRITPTIQDLEFNINKLKSDLKSLKPNRACGPGRLSSRSLAGCCGIICFRRLVNGFLLQYGFVQFS